MVEPRARPRFPLFIHICSHGCDKPAIISPFPLCFCLVCVECVTQTQQHSTQAAVTVGEAAQLYHYASFRSSLLPLALFLSLSLSLTSLLCEHRGLGAMPCSRSNDGMQTAGQLNPGLTFTAELSTQEGGRRNPTCQREGGVWLTMRNHVLFHPLENQREFRRKPKGNKGTLGRRRDKGVFLALTWRKYLAEENILNLLHNTLQ